MTGDFKTVKLAWVNKIVVIGLTWLFVSQRAHAYEGRMKAGHESENAITVTFDYYVVSSTLR